MPIQVNRSTFGVHNLWNARTAVFWGWLLACATASTAPARAQTFFEKLESAVRERLAEGGSGDASSQTPPSPSTNGEIPVPLAVPARPVPPPAGNVVLNGTQSVLETDRAGSVPAAGPVPVPANSEPLPATGGTMAVDASEPRIYLGLEAQEVVGGGIGVLVTNVSDGSPAWKAGFQRGDRIMGIGGFAIANLSDMVEQLGTAAPGESVRFLVSRDERNIELVAVLMEAGLAERIAGASLPIGDLSKLPAAGPPWLGVVVNDLSPAFRNQFGVAVFRGAAVTTVATNSPAAGIGMVAGDVITSIGGVPIETARELLSWMEGARPGQIVDVVYQRGSVSRTGKLTLEISPSARTARAASRPQSAATSRPGPPANPTVEQLPPPLGARRASGDNTSVPLVGAAGPVENVIPNSIPTTAAPAGSTAADLAELRREVDLLKAELEQANQRLQSTQNRLQQILEVLGDN